ncbi:MFS transporter [Paenibacillus endoradicis]|uniref:MFS transporter n=1 Tax=Paenibacillus endoradicis TaxID=2972487 RepID=UPI002158C157|nr:MFS transporter [Paenibacillus endoradicis]MCR8659489.1 MFS transporter [Paenibacillus endoradicis]
MKTAIWLYLFLFVAFFDLHAQYPILTPFAISLGAAPSFIGLIMGIYSITHLPGNLIASVYVDKLGSRLFIVGSLLLAGGILLVQSVVTDPWQLLILRSIAGFVLAFLSPACLSLLARLSSDISQQGKLMAGNGLVHTLASVLSPAAGAILVAKLGFTKTFLVLGWLLIVTAILAFFFIKEKKFAKADMTTPIPTHHAPVGMKILPGSDTSVKKMRWNIFLIPIGLSCSLGILTFELPLMAGNTGSIMTTGLLFTVLSIGSLITLCMLFVNKYNPAVRTILGTLALSLLYFVLAADLPVPFMLLLLLIGMSKGVVFPALSHWLIQLSDGSKYGRTFSMLSIATSIGSFLGPFLAGQVRDLISPYFIAFVVLFIALAFNAIPPKAKPSLSSNIS